MEAEATEPAAEARPRPALGWMRPSNWGISTRSAIVSATVVFAALAIAATLLIFVLNTLR